MHLIAQYPHLIYGFIILVSSVEGPVLAMLCGFLVKLGDFPFIPVYVALMLGDLLGDTVWYGVGYHFGHPFIRRFGKYFSITENSVATVEKIFNKYKTRILIISKMTMGLGFALVTLITAGMVRIPFKKYFTLNLLGQFYWTGLLLLIGYLFGNLYRSVDGIFGKMSVTALIIIAVAALMGYGKFIRARMVKASQIS